LLARLAALTFPLACPPHTTDEAKAAHIARHLGEGSFRGYLADGTRALFVAETTGLVGYTMLVEGEPDDADVAAAVATRPTAELSKVYVHPDHHGAGLAAALVTVTLDEAARRGAASVWLGVNQENVRANRFYEKNGFALVGTKRFQVGDRYEDDYVRERILDQAPSSLIATRRPSTSDR
jgi:ribosomal protein S18 acetylase RimI-like enzyme